VVLLMNEKWDRRHLHLAQEISRWSKDPSTKCGAVIVDEKRRPVSWGYNGFPRGMEDRRELLGDRDRKLDRTIHAEINALLTSTRIVEGCTLYVYPFLPCSRCAVQIIQSGISRVVSYQLSGPLKERWEDSVLRTIGYFAETGVDFLLYPSLGEFE